MKVLKKILVCTAFLLSAVSAEVLAQEVSVRVMSMNIRLGGERGGYKAEPYAELIKKYDPDFVCLQEVDHKTFRNGNRDWLNEVALQTGMFPEFFMSATMVKGAYGTAILSKYPFFRSFKSLFPKQNGEREPRACGWVCVQLPEGQVVRVMTVHFALQNATNTTRNIQHVNNDFFGDDKLTPGLMVGDFNAESGSDPILFAKHSWEEMCPGAGFTIPAEKPGRQLDFVMAYPKGRWTCKKFEILPHPELSDHCFIVADVILKTE